MESGLNIAADVDLKDTLKVEADASFCCIPNLLLFRAMSYNYKATGLLIAVGCIQDFPGWIFIGCKNEKFN